MSITPNTSSTSPSSKDDEFLNQLPKACFFDAMDISKWEGFWYNTEYIGTAMSFRSSFHARDDDVFLTSTIKTGTTWLKALSLAIMHGTTSSNNITDDILTTGNPHLLIPTLELIPSYTKDPPVGLHDTSAPRLLHTHFPYSMLPDSVKASACKIVYICRNPKDTLVSMWHFFNSVYWPNQEPFPLEKAFDCFCSGVHVYGPFFDHVAEYWVESLKRPQKILFVKYEELKRDPKVHVSKIAEFLGKPFKNEHEVDEVLRRCSLERLKNMEVNKSEKVLTFIPNKYFFRKGEVGDSKNYLTSEMEEHINRISRAKLEPLGLFL